MKILKYAMILIFLSTKVYAEFTYYICNIDESIGGKNISTQGLRVVSGNGIKSMKTQSNLMVLVATYVGFFSIRIEENSRTIAGSSTQEKNFSGLSLIYSNQRDNYIEVICFHEK